MVYFHVVFTLPHQLAPLALQNPRIVYGILFRAVAQTLLEVGESRLAARFGFLAVLHTWGQTLGHHSHVHCIVPGGGIALDGSRWVRCKGRRFFLPIRVLRHVFRGKVLDLLRQAFLKGELSFHGRLKSLAQERNFRRLLASTKRKPWMVHPKPPFGGPQVALKYLARYTHRVAISDQRLLSSDDGTVRFSYKDYAHGSQQREMTLDALEFLRRFLLHVLPKGFVRIRYYGFLANCHRREQLARARELLAVPLVQPENETAAQIALHNTVVRFAAKGACYWSRRSNRYAPRLLFSSTVRDAMATTAQRQIAQHCLDAGAIELRPAPEPFAFPPFPPALLGSRASSTLLQPPPTELPKHLRRPAGARLQSSKNIQIATARPRG